MKKIMISQPMANKTDEELLESKMKRKHITREEAFQDILDTATKTRESVDKKLGLEWYFYVWI